MPSSGSATRRGQGNGSSGVNRPLYAIDFTAVACGKRIANTKRRVRWRFGFANPDALAAGETGTACRGEEHDVTMVWSVTSGKRLLLADGQEVHYSNSRSAVIDFSWTMRGNHVLKVVAHATAPMSAEPGFRQYDFFVDGRSFFSFPKVYRLGLTGSKTMSPDQRRQAHPVGNRSGLAESSGRRKSSATNIATIEAPHNPDEEEAYLREAIKASIETEAQRKNDGDNGSAPNNKPNMSSEAADLLIDFMDDFDATGNTLPAAPAASNDWALAPAPAPAQPNNQWAAAAQPDNGWAMAPPQPPAPAPVQQQQLQQQPAYDQYGGGGAPGAYAADPNPFAPAAPVPIQQAPAPVQNYAAPAPPAQLAAPAYAQPAPAEAWGQPAPPAAPVASDPFSPQAPVAVDSPQKSAANGSSAQGVALTMGSLSTDGLLSNQPIAAGPTSSGGGTLADQALQNLMGSIDSFGITGAAAKPPAAAKNPFDTSNIMNNATLGEIKSTKQTEKKSVMNAAPGAGAMVMAAGQGGNWGGYGGVQQQQNAGQYGGGMAAAPQYSMSGGYPQQQQMQPQMGYGQQQPQMGMGQPGMMGGQQPPMQQQYGAPPPPQYGQQQPPMQQNQWGAPSY